MNSTHKPLLTGLVCAFALIGTGLLVTRAGAGAESLRAPASGAVVTVDLELVVDKLEERSAREAELKADVEGAKKKLEAMTAELDSEKSKLDLIKDEIQRAASKKALREKVLRAEIERQILERQLVERQVQIICEIYKKIDKAAEELAKQNGYAMVLASDERVEVPCEGDPKALRQAIALKRMLYVDPAMDVTTQLITLMNNQWAASKK